jgi:hypothetical protein
MPLDKLLIMPTTKVKYYTIRINEHAINDKHGLWYRQKGRAGIQNCFSNSGKWCGSKVAVFKCVQFPFWHVYPNHCTIIKEETIEA